MTSNPRLIITWSLFAAAVVLTLIAAFIVWNGIDTWLASAALAEHHRERFTNPEARSSYVGDPDRIADDDPRIALPAVDLSVNTSVDQFARIARRAGGNARPIAESGAQLAALLHQREAPVTPSRGPDAPLLAHAADLRNITSRPVSSVPETPAVARLAPQLAVLKFTLEQQVAAAWRAADADALSDACGQLLTLFPRHPAEHHCLLTSLFFAGLDSLGQRADSVDQRRERKQMLRERSGQLHRPVSRLPSDTRATFLRQLLRIAANDPGALAADAARRQRILADLRAIIAEVLPANERTGADAVAALIAAGDSEALFKAAADSNDPQLVTAAAMRAHAAERWDVVEQLLPRVAPSHNRGLELALALHRMDTLALKRLFPDAARRELFTPQVRGLRLGQDAVAFHVTNATDDLSTDEITVSLDNRAVPPGRLHRYGSLFAIPVSAGTPSAHVTLTVKGKVLAERTLKP
ncbi:MAG: hypothetical protein ACOCYP_08215 [Planctomycetota bacterium]